jgi:hypothetical protein
MMMSEEKKEVAKFFQKHAIRDGVKWLGEKSPCRRKINKF